jgi:hypothetical protein
VSWFTTLRARPPAVTIVSYAAGRIPLPPARNLR